MVCEPIRFPGERTTRNEKYKWLVPKSTQIKMLRTFGIRRFRGINEGRLEDLGSINLLVGKNNSGK
jgi:hypothetical protein